MTPKLVFISYSHREQKWLTQLEPFLAQLSKDQPLTSWTDRAIQAGVPFEEEINSALNKATVAILIVGPEFLRSDFIRDKEWPALKRAAETRGLRLYPLVAGYSAYALSFLKDYQSVNDPQAPLESLAPAEQNKLLNKLSMTIFEDMLKEASQQDSSASREGSSAPAENQQDTESWTTERQKKYDESHGYMLVHTYRPSKQSGQDFDIFLFLLRHRRGAKGRPLRVFEEIDAAEFFFGSSWGNRVFRVTNEGGLIGIRTSAWGTFLATCRLTFKNNRKPVILHRYVDFEMAN